MNLDHPQKGINEHPYVMYPVILISTEDKANVDGESGCYFSGVESTKLSL